MLKAKLSALLNIILLLDFITLAASIVFLRSNWLGLNWFEIHSFSGYGLIWLSLLHVVIHYRYFLALPRIIAAKMRMRN